MNSLCFKILLAVALIAIGASLFVFSEEPYKTWAFYKAAFQQKQSCPADWNFEALKSRYNPHVDIGDDEYKALTVPLLNPIDSDFPSAIEGQSYDGKGGTDTFTAKSRGFLNFDAIRLTNIEIAKTENKERNLINILARGLANTENLEISVFGDENLDHVFLDGCLDWGFPKSLEQSNGLPERWRLTVADNKGNKGAVEIKKRQSIVFIAPATINNWVSKFRLLPERQKKITVSGMALEPGQTMQINQGGKTLTITDTRMPDRYEKLDGTREEIISFYKKMSNKLPEQAQSSFDLVIDMMEKNKLPVLFSPDQDKQSRSLLPITINPNTVKQGSETAFSCEVEHPDVTRITDGWLQDCILRDNCPSSGEVGVMIGDEKINTLTCPFGNQLYWTGDEGDKIDDAWGDDIVDAGQGNDVIDVGWGNDIVIFQKGWGKDTLEKTCSRADFEAESIEPSEHRQEWLDKGLKFTNFIVFGPGVYPEHMVWVNNTRLINKMTNDEINLKGPCFNVVFFEEGKISE